jgi:hypothetical protein
LCPSEPRGARSFCSAMVGVIAVATLRSRDGPEIGVDDICHVVSTRVYQTRTFLSVCFSSEHFMAFQQAANKGTLVPGQTISVNKYTVQVERYLSQGLIFHPSFNDSDPL